MLTLALAAALAAAPDAGAGSPGQLRKDYGACLNKFVEASVKDKLAGDAFTVPGRSLVVLALWCAAAVAGALAALRRRA